MRLRRVIPVLALAVVAAGWYGILPPPPVALAPVPPDVVPAMRGAIHVHTSRSDGTGTVEAVAAAAASAGLRFVVLTDHGNGTRESDLPAYHSGVLVLDGVEINTREGHLVALGLPTAPYPLAGSARDVLEDVHRLGGFAIAAHPASEREELRWSDWSIDIDGLEWLNGDSEWRNEPPWSLARVLLAYPFRGQDALVTLLDRPEEAIARWDELSARRRVVAVAAADAHARIGVRGLGEPYDSRTALEVPSYEAMFRTFSISVTGVTLVATRWWTDKRSRRPFATGGCTRPSMRWQVLRRWRLAPRAERKRPPGDSGCSSTGLSRFGSMCTPRSTP